MLGRFKKKRRQNEEKYLLAEDGRTTPLYDILLRFQKGINDFYRNGSAILTEFIEREEKKRPENIERDWISKMSDEEAGEYLQSVANYNDRDTTDWFRRDPFKYDVLFSAMAGSPLPTREKCKIRQRTLLFYNAKIREMEMYISMLDDVLFYALSGQTVVVDTRLLGNLMHLAGLVLSDMRVNIERFTLYFNKNIEREIQNIKGRISRTDDMNVIAQLRNDLAFLEQSVENNYITLTNIYSDFSNTIKDLEKETGILFHSTNYDNQTTTFDFDVLCTFDKELHARVDEDSRKRETLSTINAIRSQRGFD